MLLAPEIHQDFIDRLDEVDRLLNNGTLPYRTMAIDQFAAIEHDMDALLDRSRVNVVENPGFVERLLEVWRRL